MYILSNCSTDRNSTPFFALIILLLYRLILVKLCSYWVACVAHLLLYRAPWNSYFGIYLSFWNCSSVCTLHALV